MVYPEEIIGWIGAYIITPIVLVLLLIAGFGWLIFLVVILLKVFGAI